MIVSSSTMHALDLPRFGSPPRVVIDMRQVTFMGSTGINLLAEGLGGVVVDLPGQGQHVDAVGGGGCD
ncbi:hypothetical protein [Streptomyces sp. NPDC048521]|uniref:hypothetical protein n=1 Tax=Streptomyces sp. NPDC048521 TaxID=3365566 RepID=UPI003716631A